MILLAWYFLILSQGAWVQVGPFHAFTRCEEVRQSVVAQSKPITVEQKVLFSSAAITIPRDLPAFSVECWSGP